MKATMIKIFSPLDQWGIVQLRLELLESPQKK